ncbi:MAG TPA: WbqC family protein [Bacteroidales bacterium]|nr:WbqC family protein [Bacteroidales bacterium]HRZ48120.1 WbqC family protein [Bacteroidales bacterium]
MTLSPALFPPVGYMAIWLFHPGVTVEAHEHFQKQTYRTRYQIAGPNGMQILQVPVTKGGEHHCKTTDTKVLYHGSWPVFHLRSLDTAYNKAPYYLFYRDAIEQILNQPFPNLWELCKASTELSGSLCGITKAVLPTGSFVPAENPERDYRNLIHPKKPLPWEGFADLPTYHQVFSDRYPFLPGLSILDLLFNAGPEAQTWLQGYYRSISDTLSA